MKNNSNNFCNSEHKFQYIGDVEVPACLTSSQKEQLLQRSQEDRIFGSSTGACRIWHLDFDGNHGKISISSKLPDSYPQDCDSEIDHEQINTPDSTDENPEEKIHDHWINEIADVLADDIQIKHISCSRESGENEMQQNESMPHVDYNLKATFAIPEWCTNGSAETTPVISIEKALADLNSSMASSGCINADKSLTITGSMQACSMEDVEEYFDYEFYHDLAQVFAKQISGKVTLQSK